MSARLTLLELNNMIREVLQDNLTEAFWVVAEISEMKVNRTGHCYLELVEKDTVSDEIVARARATIWSYTFRMLKPYFQTITGQEFGEGIKVLVQVMVEFHPAYGLSVNIKDIDPTYTVGDMVRRRREIIEKLKEAGVFDMNRELSLPLVPQRIAVISSATAAGYQDFIAHLEKNPSHFRFHCILFEAFMQGNEAVPSILQALDHIFEDEDKFDAVAIIRGGGAQADLSCFDNFELAWTVAQFPLPVVTGIGHEKDDTIIDLVAHTRQKTPTAAAEFFISGMAQFRERLDRLEKEFTDRIRKILGTYLDELEDLAEKTKLSAEKYLTSEHLRLNRLGQRYKSGIGSYVNRQSFILYRYRSKISGFPAMLLNKKRNEWSRLAHETRILAKVRLNAETLKIKQYDRLFPIKVRVRLHTAYRELQNHEESLRLLDPKNILQRGFSIALQEGRILKSVHSVSATEDLETRFHNGSVFSRIIKK